MLKLQWTDDVYAEKDFRDLGIVFDKIAVRLSQIDLRESGYNSARLGDPIRHDLVKTYSQGMRNGDAFPRPVAYRKGSYILTSGVQRCNALKLLVTDGDVEKDPLVEVYNLDTTDPLLLEVIGRSANVRHGGAATWEERKAHACHMVAEYGMATKEAAKLFVTSETAIKSHIATEKTRSQLAENGINTAAVPSSVIGVLSKSKLDQDSSVFFKMGHLIAQHIPTGEQSQQFVGRIAKQRSEEGRLREVKKIEKELGDIAKTYGNAKKTKLASPRAPSRPRRDQLISQLTRLAHFLDFGKGGEGFASLSELQTTTVADAKAAADLWERIEMRMTLIMKGRRK